MPYVRDVVNLHNAVTVSQQRLRKRVAQLRSARMNEVCAALRFSLGCALLGCSIRILCEARDGSIGDFFP